MLLVVLVIEELQLPFEDCREFLEVLDQLLGFVDLGPKLFHRLRAVLHHGLQLVRMPILQLTYLILQLLDLYIIFLVDLHFLKFFLVLEMDQLVLWKMTYIMGNLLTFKSWMSSWSCWFSKLVIWLICFSADCCCFR